MFRILLAIAMFAAMSSVSSAQTQSCGNEKRSSSNHDLHSFDFVGRSIRCPFCHRKVEPMFQHGETIDVFFWCILCSYCHKVFYIRGDYWSPVSVSIRGPVSVGTTKPQ
jgi:hypothetical protein